MHANDYAVLKSVESGPLPVSAIVEETCLSADEVVASLERLSGAGLVHVSPRGNAVIKDKGLLVLCPSVPLPFLDVVSGKRSIYVFTGVSGHGAQNWSRTIAQSVRLDDLVSALGERRSTSMGLRTLFDEHQHVWAWGATPTNTKYGKVREGDLVLAYGPASCVQFAFEVRLLFESEAYGKSTWDLDDYNRVYSRVCLLTNRQSPAVSIPNSVFLEGWGMSGAPYGWNPPHNGVSPAAAASSVMGYFE